jgi:endonuclease/exonuclease/phosphatase family metal-dependent hydrolase
MRLRLLAGPLCVSAALLASSPAGVVNASPAAATSGAGLRVVTFNVFQDLGAREHRRDWKSLRKRADVVLLQETAGFRVSDMVRSPRWKVFQADVDRGESAVVVRRAAVRSAGRPLVRRLLPAQDCAGAGIGPRFLVSAQLILRNGARLRVASTHLPHAGCSGAVYHRMTRHLRAWVRHHRERLVIGADWNRRVRSDPGELAEKTRLRPHGIGIDGFQVDQRLHVGGAGRLGRDGDWASDHEPVRVTIRP